jgi:murein DD-endopeptidase MepM/ murein hydrolase activator NlpD
MNLPVEGQITSGYGMRIDPASGKKKMHYGIDIGVPRGTELKSNMIGKINYAGWKEGYGNVIELTTGLVTQIFGHLDKIFVKKGQKIDKGDLIGLTGSTGYSTGPHLHWEVKENNVNVNPLEFNWYLSDSIKEWWNQLFELPDNDLFGSESDMLSGLNETLIKIFLGSIAVIFFIIAMKPGKG